LFLPLRNMYNRDPANFFLVMNREYGIPDTEVISRWFNMLFEPMAPNSSVRDLISVHQNLHARLDMARGYLINQDDAVRALLQATQFSPLRPSIIKWLQDHRGAANQTFNALATHLSEIEAINQNLATLATGPLYAPYQANGQIVIPEVNAASISTVVTNADILKAIQSLVLSNNLKDDTKADTKKSKSARSATFSSDLYCWTHGTCGHTSAVCKKPAEGHITTATAANPAGGNTAKYRRTISK
jgi:hypothetical protein